MKNIRINGYKVIDRSTESYKPDSMDLMVSISEGFKDVDHTFDKMKTIESLSVSYEIASRKTNREVRSMESDFKLFGTGIGGMVIGGIGIVLGIAAAIALFKNLGKIARFLKEIAHKIFDFLASIFSKFKFKINRDGKDEKTAKAVIQKLVNELTSGGSENKYNRLDYLYLTGDTRAKRLLDKIADLEVLTKETSGHITGMSKQLTTLLKAMEKEELQTGNNDYTQLPSKTTTTGTGKNKKTTTTPGGCIYNGITFHDNAYSAHGQLEHHIRDLENESSECDMLLNDESVSRNMSDKEAYEYLNTVYHDMAFGTTLSKRVKDTENAMDKAEATFYTIMNTLDYYKAYDNILKSSNQVPLINDWNNLQRVAQTAYSKGLEMTKRFERCATNVTKTYNYIVHEIDSVKERQKFEDITSRKMG